MDLRQHESKNISSGITEYRCRKTNKITYKANKMGRSKFFCDVDSCKKYIDRVCLELGIKQVYGSFKKV